MSRPAIGVCAVTCASWLAAVLCAADPTMPPAGAKKPAAKPAAASAPVPVEYYQVFVPADRVKDLVGSGYLPIQREEFQKRIAAIQAGQAAAPALRPSIVVADYAARLEGTDLVQGTGSWQVRTPGEKPGLLELASFDLPLTSIQWQGTPPAPAVAGATADGRLALIVPRTGQVELTWTLRAESTGGDELTFQVNLPPSPTNRFELTLPAGMSAQIDGVPSPKVIAEAAPPATAPPQPMVAATKRVQWELGGETDLRLRVRGATNAAAKVTPVARLRSTTIYDLSPRGLNFVALLRLENWDAGRKELRFTCDPGLKPTLVRLGEVELPWRTEIAAAGGATTVLVPLPATISSGVFEITVGASGPITLDGMWRLPGLKVDESVAWQESIATVAVAPGLVLQQANGIDARQQPATASPRTAGIEVYEFQCFKPTAGVEVRLASRPSGIRLASATHLTLAGDALDARQFVEFGTSSAAIYDLSAEVGPGWTIDSVTTMPPELLDFWEVTTERGAPRLTIRLARGVQATKRARLTVVARHSASLSGASFAADALSPCRFEATEGDRYVISLAQEAVSRLNLVGDARLRRLDPVGLAAPESELLAEQRPGIVFIDDEGAEGARLEVRAPQPRYAADIAVEAVARGEQLALTYRFRCVPEGGNVNKLLVQFAPDIGDALTWTDENSAALPFAVRRLPGTEPAGSPATQATYVLELGRPIAGSLVVRATTTQRFNAAVRVPLATMPQAVSQEGHLVARSEEGTRFAIQASGLDATPVDFAAPDRTPTVRGQYRYDPTRDLFAGDRGVTLVPRSADAPDAACWAWRTHVQTLARPAGETLHRADFWLENLGATHVKLRWPDDCVGQSIWIGAPGGRTSISIPESRESVLPLPAGARFVLLSVEYSQPQRRLVESGSWSPPCPTLDVPQIARRWTLWLPNDWAAYGAAPFRVSPVVPFDATGRLLGSLSRDREREGADMDGSVDGPARLRGCLAEVVAEYAAASRPLVWGPVLQGCAARLAGADETIPLRISIDDSALAQAGVTPTTPIADPAPLGSPDEWLARGGVVLVPGPDATVLVTTATALALYRDVDGPMQVDFGHREGRSSATDDGDSLWVSPVAWNAEPRRPQLPWSTSDTAWATLAASGWRGYEVQWSVDESSVALEVYRPENSAWLGWGLLLVALAVAWWWPERWRSAIPLAAGLLAAGALLTTPVWSPLFAGALAGLMFGWVVAACWPRREESTPHHAEATTIAGPVRELAPAGAALILLAAMSLPGHAAEDPPLAGAARAKPFPVLVPIDDQQQPKGPVVFVPAALYDSILSAPAAGSNAAGSVIAQSTYRGALTRDNSTGEYDLARMDVAFEVEALQPGAKVSIPFARDGWFLLEDGAKLDGRAFQPQWRADDGALEFTVAETGRYRVELAVRPSLRPLAGGIGLEWRVPRTPQTRVELDVPTEGVAIALPEARGAIQTEAGKWRADVGPTGQLTLRWPLMRAAAATGEIDQLNWLRLRPGSIVLECRVKVRSARAPISVLRWRLDPALRLGLAGTGPLLGEPTKLPSAANEQILEVKPARPLEAGSSFTVTFDWNGASGAGNFMPPRCELVDWQPARRWLGVSADSNLAVSETGLAKLVAVSTAEFAAAWGGGVAPPQVAFDWPITADASWALAAMPRAATTRVADQDLAVSVGRGEMHLVLGADLETSGGFVMQHRLQGPPGMIVESLAISELDNQRECRWAQDSEGHVTAFLAEPMAGRHRLTLVARLPSALGAARPLPRILFRDAPAREQTVHLFRQPEVLVKLNQADGWNQESSPAPFGAHVLGRRMATRVETLADPPVSIAIEANLPRVTGAQVTRLQRRGDAWEAEVDCRWQVEAGLVDVLRFDLPARIGNTLRIDPALPFDVINVPGEARKQLIVTPREPVSGDLRLRIVLPLEVGLNERRAPDVVPLDWPQLTRYLLIPQQYELRAIEGELPRFQATLLPDPLATSADLAAGQRAYQFTGRALQAVVQRLQSTAGVPQVRLADIHVDWQADGSYQAIACFDLEPGNLSVCQLALPANCRLVHVRVAGISGDLTPLTPGVWRVPLGPRQLPQRMEVLYTAQLDLPEDWSEPFKFSAPVLSESAGEGPMAVTAPRELSVERSLWTIRGPRWAGIGEPVQAGNGVPAQRQELIRLQSAAALVDLPSDVTAEMPPADIAAWYVPWVRRQVVSLSAIARLRRGQNAAGSDSIRDQVRVIESDQLTLAGRFSATGVRGQVYGDAARAYGAAELLDFATDADRPAVRLLYKGGERQVSIRYAHAGGEPLSRWLAAAVAVAAGVLLAVATYLGWLSALLARWPHALGVLFGIGWLLFCVHGWIGWIAIVASLLLLFRGPASEPRD